MSVPDIPVVEENPPIMVRQAVADVPIRPILINVQRKMSVTDNWQDIDRFRHNATSNDESHDIEETPETIEYIATMEAQMKRRQRMLLIRQRKATEKRKLNIVVVSFLILKFLLVLTCLYEPIWGLSARQTYWTIIACGFALGFAFCLPVRIRYLIYLSRQPKYDKPKETRVKFAQMTEVKYI